MKQAGTPCIPVLILLFLTPFCRSDDRLSPAKPLSPGDTIISKGGDFALGFFSPDSSNASLYLGIWYHNMAGRTIVWTTNRDDPIAAASSPTLAITNSSDLVLSDSQGRTPWAVKSDIKGSMGVTAVPLDTGNFVVQSPNGTSIWQSFDHPTDTLLPGRAMLSKKGHVVWRLIASKGLNDLSTGVFSMSLDPSSDLHFFIWNGTRPYHRRIFNGEMAVGTLYQNTVLYEAIIRTRDGFYYDFRFSGASQYAHLRLDYMGVLTLSLDNRSSWRTITAPPASCNIYASCGPFGYCDYTAAVPTCSCLDGFEPSGPKFSSGCRRIQELKCSKQSHFVTLPRMMLPDNFLRVHNRSSGDCMTECGNNCLCTAYAYANFSTNDAMADQSRCLVWTGDLIDTGKFSEYGENLYLRLANSPGMHQPILGFYPIYI
ncbi:receptor-like serine/threonine-protein kinase SD1-7 [Triticum urartu]|nr:receptor-like serine/threonine-protein kinase SD1-7 [Triticum urartu]